MKRNLAVLLALCFALTLALAACGGGGTGGLSGTYVAESGAKVTFSGSDFKLKAPESVGNYEFTGSYSLKDDKITFNLDKSELRDMVKAMVKEMMGEEAIAAMDSDQFDAIIDQQLEQADQQIQSGDYDKATDTVTIGDEAYKKA